MEKKIVYALIGALFLLLIVAASYAGLHNQNSKIVSQNSGHNTFAKASISAVTDNAFGQLENLNLGTGPAGASSSGSNQNNIAASMGASASHVSSSQTQPNSGMPITGLGGGGGSSGSAVMLRPIYDYTFKYTGDPLNLKSASLEVLKRIPDTAIAQQAANALSGFNFGLANLDSFNNTSLDNFTLSQDQDFGYSINVDLKSGTINIYENYTKWPGPETLCTSGQALGQGIVSPDNQIQNCYNNLRLTPKDMPDDQTVISIADQFLTDHNIPKDQYDIPLVLNDWKSQYDSLSSAEKANFWLPDTISVIYPLKLNDKNVYEQGGQKSGLSVEVNIRSKKVSSLYGLETQKYQSSAYEAELDENRIIKIAESGGYFFGGITPMATMYPNRGKNSTDNTVELGTPTQAYIKMYDYTSKNSSSEFMVPALIFPVKSAQSNSMFYPENVIVPLIKDVLDHSGQFGYPTGYGGGVPTPQPLSTPPAPAPMNKNNLNK